ncbi:lysophospholipid acyltransferase family protein [Candidatus Sumerlaeota bacterium]|nr:lysophospholipid acyltransferase family protein [Candidatus Sumerlaeota bacterium]
MAAHFTLKRRITASLVIALECLGTLLPMRWAVAIGAGIGWIAGHVVPVRRRVVDENLRAAFPDLAPRDRRRLCRDFYVHFGRWCVEYLFISRGSAIRRGVTFTEEGQERRDALLAEGKGFITVTGHMGSWELMGMHFAHEGHPITVLAKPLHNGYLNRHVTRSRARSGLEVIFTGTDMSRQISERLGRGKILCFLADQDSRQFGTFVEFMGRPASTPRGPAMYALRAGCPLFPVFTFRERGLRHRVIFGEPIRPPSDPINTDQAIQEMMQAYTRQLEAVIRRQPEQYFWVHRRWKTRPEDIRPKRRKRAGLDP